MCVRACVRACVCDKRSVSCIHGNTNTDFLLGIHAGLLPPPQVELPVGDLSGFSVALPAESAAPDGAPQQQQHAEVRHRWGAAAPSPCQHTRVPVRALLTCACPALLAATPRAPSLGRCRCLPMCCVRACSWSRMDGGSRREGASQAAACLCGFPAADCSLLCSALGPLPSGQVKGCSKGMVYNSYII